MFGDGLHLAGRVDVCMFGCAQPPEFVFEPWVVVYPPAQQAARGRRGELRIVEPCQFGLGVTSHFEIVDIHNVLKYWLLMYEDTKFRALLQLLSVNNSQQKECFSSTSNQLYKGMARP